MRLFKAAITFAMPLSMCLGLPASAQGQEDSPAAEAAAFDGQAAWEEFEGLLRGFYAYIDRDDLDVEAQLKRSGELASAAKSNEDFRRLIHQTSLTFMDPHLIAGPFTADDYAIIMTAADLDAAFRGGRLYISDVRRGSPAFEAGLRPGDEIVSIDGTAALQAARLPFGPVLPQPTQAQLNYGATLAVNGKRGRERALSVRSSNGTARAVTLVSTSDYVRSLRDRALVTVNWAGDADDKIAIIRPGNSLGNNDTIQAMDTAMKQAAGARAIILDLRDTPSGGNTEVARSIMGHFVTEAKPYQMHRIPSLEREFTVPRQFVEYVMPRAPYFGGPVAVLHGRWTGSMGEGIVVGMDAAADALTIGSNMGDLLGGLYNFDLEKSRARVDLGAEALFHVSGTPREDYIADKPIAPADTAPDGSDPAVAAAVEYLRMQRLAQDANQLDGPVEF